MSTNQNQAIERATTTGGRCGRHRKLLVTGAAALLTVLFASACVPTSAPNWKWHTCNVPVAGAISPTVDDALKNMTSLTGINFYKSDLVTATYHGIKFETNDLPGGSRGWAGPATRSVGGSTVADRALVVWDVQSSPPPASVAHHELGHVMGLAHSNTAVMSSSSKSTAWTAAEKAQLAEVGRASGCRS